MEGKKDGEEGEARERRFQVVAREEGEEEKRERIVATCLDQERI